jgi:multidrug efflux pump subunit AcrA (membrane-fusion protein)
MKRVWVWLMAVGLLVGLVGCSGETAPPPGAGEVPVVTRADAGRVLAEAVVEAAAQRTVSIRTGGTVLELRVADGDRVAAGEVLLRLDPIDAELAIAQAEASLAQAEAQLARLEAGPREVELAVAEAQVGTTRSVVSQALAQRDRLFSGTTEAQIAAAEADLAAAQAEELVRRITHDRTMACEEIPGSDQEHCPLLGAPEEQARFAWHAAVARRLAAEAALEALAQNATAEERIANTGVAVARAQESVAQVQLAQLEAGVAAE